MSNLEKNNSIISNLLSPYANEMDDERLGKFLALSVGRVLINKLNKNSNFSLSEIKQQDLRHITDWLKAAIINNETWLDNVDDNQRPKKLMKFSSIEGIAKEADKVMLIEAQKSETLIISEGDEKLFKELEDGYYIVELLTTEALDKEGAIMQHCIGGGAYDDHLNDEDEDDYFDDDDKSYFLSLRDRYGKPHVTIEISNETVLQMQGKQNSLPIKKYRDILTPFFKQQSYQCELSYAEIGYVVDDNDNWYKLNEIPEGTTFSKDLDFSKIDTEEFPEAKEIKLPEDLNILGSLNLFYADIKELPAGLRVHDNLCISHTDITELPNDLHTFDLNIDNTKITHIPDTVKIDNLLSMFKCPIKELPESFANLSYIYAADSELEKLPDNINVDNLHIENTSITVLPVNMRVSENFDMSGTKIKVLPENTYVGLDLNAKFSELETISNGCKIKGDLFLSKSKITKLPDDISIGNMLSFDESQIPHLPDTLSDDLEIYLVDQDKESTVGEFRTQNQNGYPTSEVDEGIKFH